MMYYLLNQLATIDLSNAQSLDSYKASVELLCAMCIYPPSPSNHFLISFLEILFFKTRYNASKPE